MSRLIYCAALISSIMLARAATDASGYGDMVAVTGTPKARSFVPRLLASPQPARTTDVRPFITADDVRAMIVAEALFNRTVPPELALAVAREESDFNPGALSPSGARGVMQIMPATALEFGIDPELLWNARINVQVGIAHLQRLYQRYGGSWESALSHYNGGTLSSYDRGEPIPHTFTRDYVANVTSRWHDYAADPAVASLVAGAKSLAEPPQALAVTPEAEPLNGTGGRARTDAPHGSPAPRPERVPCEPVTSSPDTYVPRSVRAPGAPGDVAVTGAPAPGGLLEDIEQARLSFRRALDTLERTGW
jgi:hypothetical protein